MMTTKELFNAKNNGLQIADGTVIKCVGTGDFPDKDKDGNDVMVSCLKSADGNIYTSISATIHESLEMLQQIIDESGETEVVVHQSVSNNGRKFYQLSVK